MFAGNTIPTGYLLCDGSVVSRITYSNLFIAIGTTYGVGQRNKPQKENRKNFSFFTISARKIEGYPQLT